MAAPKSIANVSWLCHAWEIGQRPSGFLRSDLHLGLCGCALAPYLHCLAVSPGHAISARPLDDSVTPTAVDLHLCRTLLHN